MFSSDKFIFNISGSFSFTFSSFKELVTSFVISSILLVLGISPSDIKSVKSDNLFGANIVSMAPSAARISASNIKYLNPFNLLKHIIVL